MKQFKISLMNVKFLNFIQCLFCDIRRLEKVFEMFVFFHERIETVGRIYWNKLNDDFIVN